MGKGKKKKTVKRASELTDNSVPRSFIFHRGDVGKLLLQLIVDMRRLMEPYTATNLKVNKNNVLKDFVNVAGPYGISHFVIFTKTEMSPYVKICRLPRGPTLTFKLEEYSLMRDVTAVQKRPKTIGSQFKYPPLVVLNSFNSETLEMKLMTTVFQNMFPAIKVQKVKLSEIRRCAMFNYDKESGCIDFRHYNIEATPVGVSRGVKKLLKNKIPNLGSLPDISDFMSGAAYLSESEGEEPMEAQVTLPQHVHGRGNMKSGQSAIRLTEMGPRLKLLLIKIEEGVSDGEVLFHRYEKRTQEEKKALRRKKEEARKLKEKRRMQQEKNMKRKEMEKELNKERSLAGMKRKAKEEEDTSDDEKENDEKEDNEKEDDDAEYYRQEVGDEPDDDLLQSKTKKRKFSKRSESDSKTFRNKSDRSKKDDAEKTIQKRKDVVARKNNRGSLKQAKVLSKRPIKERRKKMKR